eukprot:COSAG02_NODE_822_length_16778_cov_4.476168_9_plen_168_part_00
MFACLQLSQAQDALHFIVEPSWTSPIKFDMQRYGKWKYGKITVCRRTRTVAIFEENQSTGALQEWKSFSLDEMVSMDVVKIKVVTSSDRSEDIVLKPTDSREVAIANFRAMYEYLYGVERLSAFCSSHESKVHQQQDEDREQESTWWPSICHFVHECPELVLSLFNR